MYVYMCVYKYTHTRARARILHSQTRRVAPHVSLPESKNEIYYLLFIYLLKFVITQTHARTHTYISTAMTDICCFILISLRYRMAINYFLNHTYM